MTFISKKELTKLLPFIIASTLVLVDIIQTLLTPGYINEIGSKVTYVVSDPVQYAGFGLAIVLTLILVKKSVWKQVFAILIILAFTPPISFYSQTFSLGIGGISIELTALTILILHLAINPDIFKAFIKSIEKTEESRTNEFEATVKGFEHRFSKKSKQELETIVEENSLVPEAVEAAKRILKQT